ncbi:DUF3949 domain-containing protein [Ornithinibacillus salinisoli]|uniref:DUF3949 domain-containing protein n=1 Tax=Ornithinibacillus salinisoli TaxID=1848459 RepID=A0ABW4VYC6_9BACI
MLGIVIASVLVIYWAILIPTQYQNIAATKEESRKLGKHHNEINEEMSFEQQQLQYNLQGNLFNLPATLVAMLIYKIRNPEKQ